MRKFTEKDNVILLTKQSIITLHDIIKKHGYKVIGADTFYPSMSHGKFGMKFLCNYKGKEDSNKEMLSLLEESLKEFCESNHIEYWIVDYKDVSHLKVSFVRLGNSKE